MHQVEGLEPLVRRAVEATAAAPNLQGTSFDLELFILKHIFYMSFVCPSFIISQLSLMGLFNICLIEALGEFFGTFLVSDVTDILAV